VIDDQRDSVLFYCAPTHAAAPVSRVQHQRSRLRVKSSDVSGCGEATTIDVQGFRADPLFVDAVVIVKLTTPPSKLHLFLWAHAKGDPNLALGDALRVLLHDGKYFAMYVQ
jgi:hypothetical protein